MYGDLYLPAYVNVDIHVGDRHYIIGGNFIADLLTICQTAKSKSLPNFPTIQYTTDKYLIHYKQTMRYISPSTNVYYKVFHFVLYCVGGSKVPVAVYTSKTAAYALSAN